ncbi:MAG TPA: FAD-binding protein [Blastocatellia bacterium]|nr:FAD-binding protein [Blastocatellia bacterium]
MSANNPRRARVTQGPPSPWVNKHKNVSQDFDRLYSVSNPPRPVTNFFDDLQLTVAALQGLIGEAIRDKVTMRAIGGGWSLSRAAVTNGRLIDTLALNWAFPADATGVAPGYPGDPALLMYLQCGVSVREANDILFGQPTKMALKTSGASNGQTIVGAMATGTHGSRFRFGSMSDYVVGMHVIAGPDRAIWLERASYPVMSDGLVAALGAQLVRDDTLFNAALVSFGSFGIIHGVMIEADPIYLLEVSRSRVPIDQRLKRVMQTLDFAGMDLPDKSKEPFHFEVVVNPHDTGRGAYVTAMYDRKYRSGYPRPPVSPGGLGPGDDVLGVMGKLNDRLPGLVGKLVNLVVPAEYPLLKNVLGTPGEVFFANTDFQKVMSAEIGIRLEDAARVLDLMLAAVEVKDYAGLLAFRWVKGSKALLAFTKFDTTCTIELPAAYADRTMSYYNAVWQALERANIPYTLHWGQINNFTPERVRNMYGAAVDDWIKSRNTLLDAESRAVFTSPFLQQCGLG